MGRSIAFKIMILGRQQGGNSTFGTFPTDKSTTLAAIIDVANRSRKDHIITVEDPIEFVHQSQSCIINHREVGLHTRTFSSALRPESAE